MEPKPDQFVELKSPYMTYKAMCTTPAVPTTPHMVRSSSTSSRIGGGRTRSRSRPQTSFDEGIQEIDEKQSVDQLMPHSESPTDLNKIKLDITTNANSHEV